MSLNIEQEPVVIAGSPSTRIMYLTYWSCSNVNVVRFIFKDDKCTAKLGAGHFVTLMEADGVDGFIGPPCSACKLLPCAESLTILLL